jgi:hypothetical protein
VPAAALPEPAAASAAAFTTGGAGRVSPIFGRLVPGGPATVSPPVGAPLPGESLAVAGLAPGAPAAGLAPGAPAAGLAPGPPSAGPCVTSAVTRATSALPGVAAGGRLARGSTGPSGAPLVAGGAARRSGGTSPGTRSAGAGRPVIESDIGKIPSRGRAKARRVHPAGGWRRARLRSGAPARGAYVSDEHSVPTVPVVKPGAGRIGKPAERNEDGTDDERGCHAAVLRQARRCHPGGSLVPPGLQPWRLDYSGRTAITSQLAAGGG